MLGENDLGFLIGMSSGAQDDYDLGYYGTEREAIAVVSNIYYAAKAGTEFYEMPNADESDAYGCETDYLDDCEDWEGK